MVIFLYSFFWILNEQVFGLTATNFVIIFVVISSFMNLKSFSFLPIGKGWNLLFSSWLDVSYLALTFRNAFENMKTFYLNKQIDGIHMTNLKLFCTQFWNYEVIVKSINSNFIKLQNPLISIYWFFHFICIFQQIKRLEIVRYTLYTFNFDDNGSLFLVLSWIAKSISFCFLLFWIVLLNNYLLNIPDKSLSNSLLKSFLNLVFKSIYGFNYHDCLN